MYFVYGVSGGNGVVGIPEKLVGKVGEVILKYLITKSYQKMVKKYLHKSGEEYNAINKDIYILIYCKMKLTNLQKNENIYKQIYFELHKNVIKICEDFHDGDHLLLSRFNDSQADPEKFQESIMELFIAGMLPSSGNYLRGTCCMFYEGLKDLPKEQNLFIDEYQEFIHLFD